MRCKVQMRKPEVFEANGSSQDLQGVQAGSWPRVSGTFLADTCGLSQKTLGAEKSVSTRCSILSKSKPYFNPRLLTESNYLSS